MPMEENTERPQPELGPARRRRVLRTERTGSQALMIAAIPLVVLLVIVVLGAWILNAQNRDKLAAIPSPTHLPTLRPATLVAVNKTSAPTAAATVAIAEAEATATTAAEPTATEAAQPTATEAAATAEPEATATAAESGDELVAGATAQVTGTAGRGLRIRGGPSLSEPTVKVVPEGTVVTILAGPTEADGYKWYQIRDDTGTEGWVAGDWLVRSK